MSLGRFFDVFIAIAAVAGAFVIVNSAHTAGIISAWGTAFSGSVRAAVGH